jgi:iron complex outermembrane receptor protein
MGAIMKKLGVSGSIFFMYLRNVRSSIFIIGVLITFILTPLLKAIAQEEKGEEEDSFTLEEIMVTGSRIRGGETVGITPIELNREKIEMSAGVTVDRVIKELPQILDLGVSEGSRGQTGGAGNIIWANGANIHGIGPYATLVLLDGHRMTNDTRIVDTSVIPTLGLKRIDVVAEGASAVYGSDAIAGVVNLIPRRSLDGVDTLLRYGTGDSFNEYQLGFAAGKTWDRGQVMFAFEHAFRGNVNGDDRSFYTSNFTSEGGPDYRTTAASPGTIILGDGTTYAIPQGGVTQATADQLVPGTVNLGDINGGMDLLPEQKYITMNSTFNYEITDNVEFFADGFYSKRDFKRLPGYLWSNLTVPNTNAFFVQPPGTDVSSYTIAYNFMNDLAQDTQFGYSKQWEITPGFRFRLPLDFEIEALYTHGKTDNEPDQIRGLDSRGDLPASLASSDPATAFDPYGLYRTSAETLAAISDFRFLAPTINTFDSGEVRLFGPLFDMPGGTSRIAAGYEYQKLDVDLGNLRGTPGTPFAWRNFGRSVNSGYVELFLPVVGSGNAVSGINRLYFTGAVRYDDYDDVGSTTNPKFALNYSPTETLSFKGNWGTSFRAPQITEIYGNTNAIYSQRYTNPSGGDPVIGYAWSGSNLDLQPEEATNWSIGGEFTPTENTKLSLVFFSVDYEGKIIKNLSNLQILRDEPYYEGTGVILRGAEAGAMCAYLDSIGLPLREYGGPYPNDDPSQCDLYIDGRNRNLGVSKTEGFDFQISQSLNTESTGSFLFNFVGTYLTQYEEAITKNAEMIDKLNDIFNPLRFKARGTVTWNYSYFTTQLAISYVNSYDNTLISPTESVDSYIPVDLVVRVAGDDVDWLGKFGNGLSLTLEARNLFDTDLLV